MCSISMLVVLLLDTVLIVDRWPPQDAEQSTSHVYDIVCMQAFRPETCSSVFCFAAVAVQSCLEHCPH